MRENDTMKNRLLLLPTLLCTVVVLFLITMYVTQVVRGSEYRARSISSNAKSEIVETSRGLLTDRNGKVLVSNALAYTLRFSAENLSDSNNSTVNDAIFRLLQLLDQTHTDHDDPLPISQQAPWVCGDISSDRFSNFCKKHKLNQHDTAKQLLADLRALYGVDTKYTDTQARAIVGIRYALYFSDTVTIAENVPVEIISRVTDGHYAGVTTGISTRRVYNTPYAAHLLGRISKIYEEDWAEYANLGYPMDALVGSSGVEKAFESYLHGENGVRLITTDDTGSVTGELYTKPPRPGNTVALTLDIDLQGAAEEALASTIEAMIDGDSNERGGAIVVTKVGTGEVLACASYPSYDLSQFNETYGDLISDARLPLFNRAVDGVYAPGSTFKPITAVAALEEGIITPSTTVQDRGRYTYYQWPQPQCWVYASGYTHGVQNVTQAITNSCNYFFYEVGRLTGIDTIDTYARMFGLGSPTGIEIGDSSGTLASPSYAESAGLDWTEGQVITAAIGQSYNLFTPIQLSNYVATLVGGGDHYKTHLLKSVKTYDNTQLVYVYDAKPINTVSISDTTMAAVTDGMHDLTTGSLWGSFSQCVVSAGAKTGSAQVGTDIANGVFVAYAPFEDPEIAVSIVIEKGGSGAALAGTAVSVINAYFSNDAVDSIVGENTLVR